MGRTRITMTTEGTYPFAVGGVSTWCHTLLSGTPEIDWQLVAIAAGDRTLTPAYEMPRNSSLAAVIEVWGESRGLSRTTTSRPELAAELLRGLLGWDTDPVAVVPALVWLREHPDELAASFRGARAWSAFLDALADVLSEAETLGAAPTFDLGEASTLYRTLSWIARAAAIETPVGDLSHVTAAGWAAIPAVVDKALRGTPILLTEHGLYVREAYLAAVRGAAPPAQRFWQTRLARGLARMSYATSDVVSPVCEAHRAWEEALGAAPDRIIPIPNGVTITPTFTPPPETHTVVSVGRLDPLKDVFTMLRTAAAVVRQLPDVTFLHYGPVPEGGEAYAQECHKLHEELGLGERFRFMGPTRDPHGVMRESDVVLMTSISEGFPISVLEALSQGRPVVTTLVGGVVEAMTGAGLTAPPGDADALASGVLTLLRKPELAIELGRRGQARVDRLFSESRFLERYRSLFAAMTAPLPAVHGDLLGLHGDLDEVSA